jgi:hypothetical protein
MIAPKNPNPTRNVAVTEIVNERFRNSPRGTIGSATRDSIQTKSTPNASPTSIRPPTSGSVQSRTGGPDLLVRPTRNGPMAAAKAAAPK